MAIVVEKPGQNERRGHYRFQVDPGMVILSLVRNGARGFAKALPVDISLGGLGVELHRPKNLSVGENPFVDEGEQIGVGVHVPQRDWHLRLTAEVVRARHEGEDGQKVSMEWVGMTAADRQILQEVLKLLADREDPYQNGTVQMTSTGISEGAIEKARQRALAAMSAPMRDDDIPERSIAEEIAKRSMAKYIELDTKMVDLEEVRGENAVLFEKFRVLPMSREDDAKVIPLVTARVPILEEIAQIEKAYKMPAEIHVTRPSLMHAAIDLYFYSGRENRRNPRLERKYPVRFGVLDAECDPKEGLEGPFPGLTVDLSEGGFLFTGKELPGLAPTDLLADGTHLSVVVAPDGQAPMHFLCDPVRVGPVKDVKDSWLYAVHVVGASPEDKRKLKLLIIRAQLPRHS